MFSLLHRFQATAKSDPEIDSSRGTCSVFPRMKYSWLTFMDRKGMTSLAKLKHLSLPMQVINLVKTYVDDLRIGCSGSLPIYLNFIT